LKRFDAAPPAFTSGSAIPTRSAISEYTRAWFWPIEPTPMTPTRIGAVTAPRRRPPDINAWRARSPCRSLHIRSRLRSDVRCFNGSRSGVRQAREPAQRVLDDLVQGHAVLLLRGGLPAQVRPQARALSATCPGPTPERSHLLIRPASASLETSQRFGRRNARGADGGAGGREDRPDERDSAQEQQSVPGDHERGLGREEPQIEVVRQRDAEGDPHRDSRERNEREFEQERFEDHRFAEPEGAKGPGLLPPLDDVAHRDDAESRDSDDQPDGEVRLEQIEHAHRRLED